MLDALPEVVTVTVYDGATLTVLLPHADTEGETLAVEDTDPVPESETKLEAEALDDGDALFDVALVDELQPVIVGLALELDVPVDDAVLDSVLDELEDEDAVAVDELVLDGLAVGLSELEALPELVIINEYDDDPLFDVLPHEVNEGEALVELVANSVAEEDRQPDTDTLGDDDEVAEAELVDEPVDELDPVAVDDDVLVIELEGDADGEALGFVVNVPVRETDADAHADTDALCVCETEPVVEDDGHPDTDTLGDDDAVLELELDDVLVDVPEAVAVDDTELVDDDVLDPVLDELDEGVEVDDDEPVLV